MSERLDPWLEQLEAQVGDGALARTRRVELTRDGRLVATLEAPQEWFVEAAGGAVAARPEEDRLRLAPRAASDGVEVLSWRLGRRIVLRDGDGIWKGYRRRRSGPAADAHRRAAQVLDERAELSVPPLVAERPELDALVFEALDGRALAPLDPSSAGGDPDLFFRIGDGLRTLQTGASTEGLALHAASDELELLGRLAGRQAGVLATPPGWDAVFARLGALDLTLEGRLAPVAVHRDLHDGQLLLCGERLFLFDFDLLCLGSPAQDAGNLIAHLELRVLQGQGHAERARSEACGSALLEGLEPPESDEFRASLRFHQAATFLRLARVYALRPRWRTLCPRLVELAELCLEEVPRARA